MKSFFNRAPLSQNFLASLSLGKIQPQGWLEGEIKAKKKALIKAFEEAEKLSYADYASAVLALVNVAYTCNDNELKTKAAAVMEEIIASKREDGWFGRSDNADYMPLITLVNALYLYFGASGDKRALIVMDGFFKYQYKNLTNHPLEGFASARAADNIYAALKLYNITEQKYLLELCKKLKSQMLDWTNIFNTFPNVQPMSKSMSLTRLKEGRTSEKNDLKGEDHPFFATYYHQSQGVNVAMGLKAPGVVSLIKSGFKEQNGFSYGWDKLMKYHGTALGMFTCDSHLDGNDPSVGIETEAVCETLRSMETLLDCGSFGENICDLIEKLSYNALPAAFNEEGDKCQKLQQTNQCELSDKGNLWYDEKDDANCFGAEGSELALIKAIEAWAGFAGSLWLATNDLGLSAVSYAPCEVNHIIENVPIKLTVSGEYPFGDTVEISIETKKPLEFPLYLRIPAWAINPMIYLPNGEIMTVRAGETACLRQRWSSGETIKLILPKQPRIAKWSHQSSSVELGALLMALPLEYEKRENNGLTEYSYTGKCGLAIDTSEAMKLEIDNSRASGFAKGKAPIKVLSKVCQTPLWKKSGSDFGSIPIQPECKRTDEFTAELVPYGSTILRISQFPTAKTEEKDA